MPTDVEVALAQEKRRGGYPAAASWLAADPDHETLVFRRFDKLAALNLLYLQSEMLEMEQRIDAMHQEALYNGDMAVKEAGRKWETLTKQCVQGSPGSRAEAQKKMDTIQDLRVKMEEYQEALLRQSRISQLKHPQNRVLQALRYFFTEPYPILLGKAKTFLDEPNDLVALKSPGEVDILSDFLRKHLVQQKELCSDGTNHFGRFEEATVAAVVNVLTVICGISLLFGPVLGLYFVQNAAAKLSMVVVFTAAFTVTLSLITNARRAEIFGATAAYAAVLVVFVSNGSLTSS